jgi:menaquinone-dependent protoporphyrinogen oxidase
MNGSVLVGFATRYGSTQEVAEAVAEELRGEGLAVEFKGLRDVRSLEGYQGVVVGAPLQMFHWHKDALAFLNRHREALAELRVAVFALGPFNDEEKEWTEVRGQLDKELAKVPWLKPVEVKVFGGKFDPQTLRFPYNLLPGLKKMAPHDIRDWDDIAAWGRGLGAIFQDTAV